MFRQVESEYSQIALIMLSDNDKITFSVLFWFNFIKKNIL